ncbi:hypothetical protein J3R30DRAFT_3526251 [Lentinula aciculospora]|uniref:Uncharacterized protein n=1 Tax=Lentinula aciculospora TaxID=153920 RepID=A0A9W9A1Q3_9AGAR|nr:hypothetical protein J3R30DRAFT_3526251 [Lentinula aciculospora]
MESLLILTSAESRAALHNVVDRVTPKLPLPPDVTISHEDVAEFNAFFAQYINPSFADKAFDPLLSDVVRDNTPSEFGPFPAVLPHVASSAPSESIVDSTCSSVQPSSLAEPEPATSTSYWHTPASLQVACQLYPDILPSRMGMEPLTPESHGKDFCRVVHCGKEVDVAVASLSQHIAACHIDGPVQCKCGLWFKGSEQGAVEMAWHIHSVHFSANNFVCRSCNAVRNYQDFAIHLRMCPAFEDYRICRESRMAIGWTPAMPAAGANRPLEFKGSRLEEGSPLFKKTCTNISQLPLTSSRHRNNLL